MEAEAFASTLPFFMQAIQAFMVIIKPGPNGRTERRRARTSAGHTKALAGQVLWLEMPARVSFHLLVYSQRGMCRGIPNTRSSGDGATKKKKR